MTTRYRRTPPAEYLSAKAAALAAEIQRLAAQHEEATSRQERLNGGDLDEDATEADRETLAAAIRAGKAVASVGTPAQDRLRKDRSVADREVDALGTLIKRVDDEFGEELQVMQLDDALSGRTALEKSRERYRKAIGTVASARADFIAARAVHDWLAANGSVPGYSLGPVWRGTERPVRVDQISRVGELDAQMRPVKADHLLAVTFAAELDERDPA
jgi:hypothetical protein